MTANPNDSSSAALGAAILVALVLCAIEGEAIKAALWLLVICVGLPLLWIHYVSKTYENRLHRSLIMIAAAGAVSIVMLLF